MATDPKNTQPIVNEVRRISLLRIESLCGISGFAIDEPHISRAVTDHWLAQIVISGSGLKLFFRAYFASDVIRNWASGLFKLSKDQVTLSQTHDLAKEYCNLVAGEFKTIVARSGLVVGTSLPCITRGFDRVFVFSSEVDQYHESSWLIKRADRHITCSAEVEFGGKGELLPLAETPDTSEGVEFF